MRTNVKQSSIDCYYSQIAGSKEPTQADVVAQFVLSKHRVTRRQIAEALMMETGTVAARVNKLIADKVLIESELRAPCPITGVAVHWLQHRDNERGQLTLI